MQYARLGRTALEVSRVCLGTLGFGVHTTREGAFALMDEALDHGVNIFDTANHYGWEVHEGMTEELIGEWFAQGGGRRDKVVLATKVYNPMSDWPNDRGLSARHIIASCEGSLRRLGTEWIDLLQMHHVDRNAPWDEVWQAMETLVRQGKVRYVGSSNFAGWHLASAQAAAERRHFLGLVSEQCVYNLVTRHAEMEVIPAAQAHGIGVMVWSPLRAGLLSGSVRKLREGVAVRSGRSKGRAAMKEHWETVAAYEEYCDSIGADPAEVALGWVFSRPGVTAAVIGPRSSAHLHGALRALESPPGPEVEARLEALFPPVGKGGAAPEAWAW